jgi:hypothetical protein
LGWLIDAQGTADDETPTARGLVYHDLNFVHVQAICASAFIAVATARIKSPTSDPTMSPTITPTLTPSVAVKSAKDYNRFFFIRHFNMPS